MKLVQLAVTTAIVGGLALGAHAQGGLKEIRNPGGGIIVYGNFSGSGTPDDAAFHMLKTVHDYFKSKPEVKQVFRDRTNTTLGIVFSCPIKPDGSAGNVTGLLLVDAPSADHRSGAVVVDGEKRFRTTVGPMMERLNQEWPPKSMVGGGGMSGPAAPAQPLQKIGFPDGTGWISLPQGWQMTNGSGGAVMAKGPSGEDLYFNDSATNYDPSLPSSRQMISLLTRGGKPMPSHCFVNSFSRGAGLALVSMMQQRAQKQHSPIPSIQIDSQSVTPDNSILFTGRWDNHDGRGAMAMMAMVRVINRPTAQGTWTMFTYHMCVPFSVLNQDAATIPEIWKSFGTNDHLIMTINEAFTEHIHEMQRMAKSNVGSGSGSNPNAQGAEDSSDVSYRGSQAVCNYLRGRSVIGDTQTGGQATVDNDLADELVRSNPERLEIVPPSQFNHGQY